MGLFILYRREVPIVTKTENRALQDGTPASGTEKIREDQEKHANQILLPQEILGAITALEAQGHTAYAVGGCVRDALMGVAPKDYDITTSATPEEIHEVFASHRLIDTGLKHGTVTVLLGVFPVEITTFRKDGTYTDGRHPDNVAFTPSLEEDLVRRDFTVNAMAYSDRTGLVDISGGVDDLERGVIRCVGDAERRFSEDALRILRALRFSSRLSFEIAPETAEAIHRLKDNLRLVSPERIMAELNGILAGRDAPRILFEYADVLLSQIPEAALYPGELPLTGRLLSSLSSLPLPDAPSPEDAPKFLLPLRLAALLRTAKDDSPYRLLKYDNRTRAIAYTLSCEGFALPPKTRADAGRLLGRIPTEAHAYLPHFYRAVAEAAFVGIPGGSADSYRSAASLLEAYLSEGAPFTVSMLALKGKDLLDAHLASPGEEMGRLLTLLLEACVDGTVKNEKKTLLTYLKEKVLS